MTGRVGGWIRAAALSIVALVLAHNLIFLAGYGARFGDAMAHTGHDHGWTAAVLVSLVLGVALVVAGLGRIRELRRQARSSGAGPLSSEPDLHDLLGRWLRGWIGLTLVIAGLFVLQENVEISRVARDLPGIGVLDSTVYPNAAAIIALVGLVVSLLATLLGWELDVLVARIRAMAASHARRATTAPRPAAAHDRPRRSLLGSRRAGRAPPRGWVFQA